MKWTRKTNEFEYADYISENNRFHIRDMEMNSHKEYLTHIENGGKKSEYWALLENNNIITWGKTVKSLKQIAESIS